MTETVDIVNLTFQQTSQHYDQPQRIHRNKPNRRLLPSAIISYDDRATWWSAREHQETETVYTRSSHNNNRTLSHSNEHQHSQSIVTCQSAPNDDYEEALRSEVNSTFTAARHGHNAESISHHSHSDQTHSSNMSSNLFHHFAGNSKEQQQEGDLKEMWDIASSLLKRPASTYSYSVAMSSAGHFQKSLKNPEPRQRSTFGLSTTAAASSNRAEYDLDPYSIAEGIIDFSEEEKRPITPTALTLTRGLQLSPLHCNAYGNNELAAMTYFSVTEKSFSDSEQVREPRRMCRWWVMLLCLFIFMSGVVCIVLGCLLSRNGGDWSRLFT